MYKQFQSGQGVSSGGLNPCDQTTSQGRFSFSPYKPKRARETVIRSARTSSGDKPGICSTKWKYSGELARKVWASPGSTTSMSPASTRIVFLIDSHFCGSPGDEVDLGHPHVQVGIINAGVGVPNWQRERPIPRPGVPPFGALRIGVLQVHLVASLSLL